VICKFTNILKETEETTRVFILRAIFGIQFKQLRTEGAACSFEIPAFSAGAAVLKMRRFILSNVH
jgi:hypothetical protein